MTKGFIALLSTCALISCQTHESGTKVVKEQIKKGFSVNKDGFLIRDASIYKGVTTTEAFAKRFAEKMKKVDPGQKTWLPKVPKAEDIQIHSNLIYTTYGRRALLMDVFCPKATTKDLPAVILVHGGGWNNGEHHQHRATAISLARMGYVTATVEYRLGREAKLPAAIHDLKASIRFLRANAKKFGIDASNIGMLGGSAGGHLTLLTGMSNEIPELEGKGAHQDQSSSLQAIVSFYGLMNIATPRSMHHGAVKSAMGVSFNKDPKKYIRLSPLFYVTPQRKKKLPRVLFFGESPPAGSSATNWKFDVEYSRGWMTYCGVVNEEGPVINALHGYLHIMPYQKIALVEVDRFFKKHLKSRTLPRTTPKVIRDKS